MGFINQFPYSDFHELNLDWIIKKTKNLSSQMDYIQEEFSKIVILTVDQINAMIEAAIASNNIEIYNSLAELKAQITMEYQSYVQNQIANLKLYVDTQDVFYNGLAQSYADHAVVLANEYTDNKLLDYTMMVSPVTGEYEDVRDVVNEIVLYFHSENTLTAGEYDALDLTAATYDGHDLSAFDYDFNGKNLLP